MTLNAAREWNVKVMHIEHVRDDLSNGRSIPKGSRYAKSIYLKITKTVLGCPRNIVNKWFVNGLKPTFKGRILGL